MHFTDDRTVAGRDDGGRVRRPPEEALETPVVLAGTLEEMIDDVLGAPRALGDELRRRRRRRDGAVRAGRREDWQGRDGARSQVPLRSADRGSDVGAGLAGEGAQDRGARLLDAVHARPLHRHSAARRWSASRWRPRRRTTLRVGTLVLGNDYKHPAVVAKEVGDARRAVGRSGRARHRRRVDDRRLRRARSPVRLAGTRIERLERRSRS